MLPTGGTVEETGNYAHVTAHTENELELVGKAAGTYLLHTPPPILGGELTLR